MTEKWQRTSSFNNPNFLDVIPYSPGVYALYFYSAKKKKTELVYIGSSLSLKKRLLTYELENYGYSGIQTRFGYTSEIIIKFKPVKEYGRWLMLEAQLIRRLNPKFNTYHKEK